MKTAFFGPMIIHLLKQTNKQPRSEHTHALCVYFSCYSQKERDEQVNLSASDAAWHKAVYFPFPLCLTVLLSFSLLL